MNSMTGRCKVGRVSCLGFWMILAMATLWPGPLSAHVVSPSSVVFDKTVNTLFQTIITQTISVTDPTGCAADLTATSQDTTVVRVAPASATAVVSLNFTVIRVATKLNLGPSSTDIVLTIKGVGTDAMGNPCTDNGSITIPVEIKPGILGVTPPDPTVLLFNQGDTSVRGNKPSYVSTNTGDDFFVVSFTPNATWFELTSSLNPFLLAPGETLPQSVAGNLGIIQSLSSGQYNGTLSIKTPRTVWAIRPVR